MPNALRRLAGNVKKKSARRKYKRDSKYIIDDFGSIAAAFNPTGIFGSLNETEDDASSISSDSTLATIDDNPGTGWTVDKYFYQPVGRRIEKILFRIAMPLLSPGNILQHIQIKYYDGRLYFFSTGNGIGYNTLSSAYLAGLDSLVHQTQ